MAKEKKMIAYAASAGCAQLSVNDFKQLAFHLKNFVQIGVRESALYKKISLINNNVSITVTPYTFIILIIVCIKLYFCFTFN